MPGSRSAAPSEYTLLADLARRFYLKLGDDPTPASIFIVPWAGYRRGPARDGGCR